MVDQQERIPANGIRRRQKKAWNFRSMCFEYHAIGEKKWHQRYDMGDPRPRFFNAVLEYYSILRPYLKSMDNIQRYWDGGDEHDKDIDLGLPGDGKGLKQLDAWRFKNTSESVTNRNPNTGQQKQTVERPEYMNPEATARILDVLDEVSLKLGFNANAEEPETGVEITDEDIDEVQEIMAEKIEKHKKGELNGGQ